MGIATEHFLDLVHLNRLVGIVWAGIKPLIVTNSGTGKYKHKQQARTRLAHSPAWREESGIGAVRRKYKEECGEVI